MWAQLLNKLNSARKENRTENRLNETVNDATKQNSDYSTREK